MSRWFCFGKKDFCDNVEECRYCKFADGSGSVSEDEVGLVLSKIFGDDYDIDRLEKLVEADRNHLLKEQKTQTNADKIRSMTDEALGKWICSIMSSDCCKWTCPARNMCGLNDNGLVKWLKQSARED